MLLSNKKALHISRSHDTQVGSPPTYKCVYTWRSGRDSNASSALGYTYPVSNVLNCRGGT